MQAFPWCQKPHLEDWPHKTWKSSSVRLRTYSGELVPVRGAVDVEVLFKGRKWSLELLVVIGNGASLMDRSWLLVIPGILEEVNTMVGDSLDKVIKKHSPLFTEKLGTLSGYKAKIQVDPMAVPRFCKARSVPYSIKVKVEEELTRLVAEGILEPVTFSDWAAPIAAIRKSDKQSVRICGDYKMSVNPVFKLDRYPIPRVEDLFATLSGGESFSKIDLSQAYNQVLLDEDSKQYTVINTHKGLFRYNRLPFGINSAPGIFQRVMKGLLQGMDGVIVYIDNILVTGKTRTEHIKTLDEVLARLGKAGLHLNKNKCVFLAPSVSYLGFCIDSQGLHPLPEKVRAIQDAPKPSNVTELKSFLGLVQYYSKFLPNLYIVQAPLYRLLRKGYEWKWAKPEGEAFAEAKKLLTSSQLLVHYDPALPIVLACDASSYGIGAVLSHKLSDGSERLLHLHLVHCQGQNRSMHSWKRRDCHAFLE